MKLDLIAKMVAALLLATSVAQAGTQIIAVADNSALVTDAAAADQRRKMLIAVFAEEMPRDAVLTVIDTQAPSVKWHGTPQDANNDLPTLLGAMKINPQGCADLTRAFDHVHLAAQRSESDDIRIVVLSPLLHTGAPCGGALKRPQAMPAEIRPERFLEDDRITSWELYAPDRFQQPEWFSTLKQVAEHSGSDTAVRMFTDAEALKALSNLHERD